MKLPFLLLLLTFSFFGWGQTPTVGLTQYSDEASGGFTFFCPQTNDCYLVDECGQLVNKWERFNRPGLSAKLLENGLMLRSIKTNGSFFQASTGGGIELVDWNNNTVGSYSVSTDQVIQHHDVLMMPNGNLLLLFWQKMFSAELNDYGSPLGELWSEGVYELRLIDNDEYEIVWEWNLKNHMIQDVDNSLENYAIIKDNIGKVDINYEGPATFNNQDRWHCNAIDYNHELDQVLINSRNNSELWIIDHSTTTEEAATSQGGNSNKGGELLFRWGNPAAYDSGNLSDLRMFGSHGTYWIPEGLPNAGKIMYFNNGDSRPEGWYSTIEMIDPIEQGLTGYELDENQFYFPLEPEVVYQADNPFDFSSNYLSNAQQLENGNVFINEGGSSRFFEVVPGTNEIVWEYISPINFFSPIPQGQSPNNSSSFRANIFDQDYAGFEGQDLTGGQFLELDPYPSLCGFLQYINIDLTQPACSCSDLGSVTLSLVGVDSSSSIEVYNEDNELVFGENLLVGDEVILNDLQAGQYFVEVVCGEDCMLDDDFVIIKPVEISVDFINLVDEEYCASNIEVGMQVIISGGILPYSYTVYDIDNEIVDVDDFVTGIEELSIPSNGEFVIEVIDQNGCVVVLPVLFELSEPVDPFVVTYEVNNASGINANDGSIVAHVTGGYPPYDYSWISYGGEIGGDSIVTNLSPGFYVVACTDLIGCQVSDLFSIEVMTNTDEINLATQFDIFPNPSSGIINLQFDESLNFQLVKLTIVNTYGQEVMAVALEKKNSTFNVNALPVGIYFARLSVEGESVTKRFVKL